jgi:hypothetical protein
LLFATKIAFEWVTGKSLFTNIGDGALVETAAHAFGAILGVTAYLISQTSVRWLRTAEPADGVALS